MFKITTNKTYLDWIKNYKEKQPFIRGKCYSATLEMAEEFPELRQERGYVTDILGEHQHWWCVEADGSIVDPTDSQFYEIIDYDAYNEEKHGPLPTGKCMDCGGYVYNDDYFCDKECERKTLEYLKSGQL